MNATFTHLHLHTQYSLLDGAIRIKELPKALLDRGFSACAITDHGNLFGAIEFYEALKHAGLKPIIGIEAYIAEGSRTRRKYDRPGHNARHLLLLCQNRTGYRNLIRLASLGYTEGKHYGFPRIDQELLEQYNEGLIALSSSAGGVLKKPLLAGDAQLARETARWYGQVFHGRFYVEIQDHGLEEQRRANDQLVALAADLGLPLVGTNDCHYLTPEEAYPHYLLQLIGRQQKVTDPSVTPFVDKGLYLKSPEEMREALAAYPAEAYANAGAIADMCELSLECDTFYLPQYHTPDEFTEEAWFRKQAAEGVQLRFALLERRYGIAEEQREASRAPYLERLEYELGVITSMNYAGYFLIVADIINWAKDDGVRVGPGRGSGAGSLVAYALRITNLDPIHHGLLFERFLNPERVSLPDFDIDFDVDGRDRVIDYVRGKYGAEKVCQISTFGSLGAKAALRNVARVLDFPYSQADRIAKLIPDKLGITLQEAIDLEPELARLEREGEENEKTLIRCGKALEGLNSNLSTHAAGLIIMNTDIQEVLPVCSPAKGEGIQSMYSMKWAEHQGAVKFDFLGLLNLTIIKKAEALINGNRPPGENALDIDEIPLDDEASYALLCRGDTTGVFQLESGGMRRLLMDLKPTTFEDLVATLALYRPGPLGSGMTAEFVRRKSAGDRSETLHPLLEPVLRETYGVMAYQEQVMEAARVLAGYTLGEADLLRRAIGKKIPAEMEQQRDQFVEGCTRKGIPREEASNIFDKIDYFSGYGFNKSHSAAYGLIAYQTAFLKARYPVEFMAALLSSNMDNTDKVVNIIADCREMGVPVLPPDINHSRSDFTIDGSAVRFGLSAVKNVGENAVAVILAARDAQPGGRFDDLATFLGAVDLHRVNKRVLEGLIKGGGFDSLHPNRAQLLEGLEGLVRIGLSYRNSQVEGQENLFDLLGEEGAEALELRVELPDAAELHPRQRLKLEKEALGFYISGHPLERYRSEVGNLAVSTLQLREGEYADKTEVLLAGMVAALTVRMNRSGEKQANVRLEDLRGSIEVIVFPKLYAEVAGLLQEDEPLLIRGRVNVREEEINVRADQVTSLSRYRSGEASRMTITLARLPEEDRLPRLVGLLSTAPGTCAVCFQVAAADGSRVLIDAGVSVAPGEAFMEELEAFLGDAVIAFDYPRESRATVPGNGNVAGNDSAAVPTEAGSHDEALANHLVPA
ncbi:MAG: DNA polymerase III subunit alpha [SAR324 cluster bacterium]|nr:DNA polymerase III subunit alpha [SAR324 cluster bacterium]